jgi:hypothetical protein
MYARQSGAVQRFSLRQLSCSLLLNGQRHNTITAGRAHRERSKAGRHRLARHSNPGYNNGSSHKRMIGIRTAQCQRAPVLPVRCIRSAVLSRPFAQLCARKGSATIRISRPLKKYRRASHIGAPTDKQCVRRCRPPGCFPGLRRQATWVHG